MTKRRLLSLVISFPIRTHSHSISSQVAYIQLLSIRKPQKGSLCRQNFARMSMMTLSPSNSKNEDSVQQLSLLLENKGQASKKAWWEKYLKHEIAFYGTPMADIRASVKTYINDTTSLTPAQQRELTWNMFRQPIAEQKLAAILILQEHLLPCKEILASRDLPELVALFQQGFIADWNTTDWLCVRVLGPLIEQDETEDTAKMIAPWVHSNVLWQKRAALVAFVNLAPKGIHSDLILETAAVLVQDDERFAQTGVGWVLRSLSDVSSQRVHDFLVENKQYVNTECMRMATARLSDKQRKALGVTGKRKRR